MSTTWQKSTCLQRTCRESWIWDGKARWSSWSLERSLSYSDCHIWFPVKELIYLNRCPDGFPQGYRLRRFMVRTENHKGMSGRYRDRPLSSATILYLSISIRVSTCLEWASRVILWELKIGIERGWSWGRRISSRTFCLRRSKFNCSLQNACK